MSRKVDRIRFGVVLSILISVCLVGCKEKSDPPGITLSSSKLVDGIYEAAENETVSINVKIEAPGGVKLLRVTFTGITRPSEDIAPTNPGSLSFETTYELSNWVYGSGPFDIVFTAIDGTDGSSNAKVTVQPGLPAIEILESKDVQNDTLFAFTGQLYQFKYRYSFPAGFNRFTNTLYSDGQKLSESLVTSLPPTQGTSVTDQINQALEADLLGTSMNYTLEIVDKFGESETRVVPVILKQKPTEKFSNVEVAVPDANGTLKAFFSASSGNVYSPGDVNTDSDLAAIIDFGYYYDQTDFASFTGPANFPTNIYNVGPNGDKWSPLNVANFKRTGMSVAEFDALDQSSQAEIISAYETATGNGLLIISDLQVNEVIAFKTKANEPTLAKFGLFKVISVVPGGAGVGSIKVDVIANQ